MNIQNLPENDRQVILQADPAHQGRPAKSDPLTIRDDLNWCDPIVRLDAVKLTAQVALYLPQRMPAFAGWQLQTQPETKITWADEFMTTGRLDAGRFSPTVNVEGGPLTLTRELQVRPEHQWLIVSAFRHNRTISKTELVVAIDGIVIEEAKVSSRSNSKLPTPVVVSLTPYVGHRINIAVTQKTATREELSAVHWQTATIAGQLPMLHRVFEERGSAVQWTDDEQQTQGLVEKVAYTGERCIRLNQGERLQIRFEQPLPIRAAPQWNQFRFLRFATRKHGGGSLEVEFDTQAARANPLRYVAGKPLETTPKGKPIPPSVNVWKLELPPEWIVTTRDAYSDFGDVEITGLTISVPDGEYALIDHFYLGREGTSFDLLPKVPSPELTNQKARRELARTLLDKGHAATVALHIDGRQATGVLIGGEGHLVTAGHVLGKPGREFEVQLPTGQLLPARSLGIDRGVDIGLAEIIDHKELPLRGLSLSDQPELATNDLYVGFTFAPFEEEIPGAIAHIVGLRRSFRDVVWTDFHLPEATTGGPLLARDGRVVGIHSSTSTLGGFHYAKAATALAAWQKLKKGEVTGDWFPGTGPMLGLVVTTTSDGAKVSQVIEASPAVAAGFAAGDLLTKLDGRVVKSLEDVYRYLATKNPGDEVTVELSRDGKPQTQKVKLMPRVP